MTTAGGTRSGRLTRARSWWTPALLAIAVGVAAVLDLAVLASGEPATSGATDPTATSTVAHLPASTSTAVVPAPPATPAPATGPAPPTATPPPVAPAPTIPSAPAGPEVLAYAAPGDAGEVVLTRGSAGIELAGVTPSPGWSYEVDHDEHDRIEVEFVNEATGEEREWELRVDDEDVEHDD